MSGSIVEPPTATLTSLGPNVFHRGTVRTESIRHDYFWPAVALHCTLEELQRSPAILQCGPSAPTIKNTQQFAPRPTPQPSKSGTGVVWPFLTAAICSANALPFILTPSHSPSIIQAVIVPRFDTRQKLATMRARITTTSTPPLAKAINQQDSETRMLRGSGEALFR